MKKELEKILTDLQQALEIQRLEAYNSYRLKDKLQSSVNSVKLMIQKVKENEEHE